MMCPICQGKVIEERPNHMVVFLVCYNCNKTPVIVGSYQIKKPKRIDLTVKKED